MSTVNFRNEANRANAQKSTGPRTEEGKARSRANALKHGLAAMIVSPDQDAKELEEARGRWIDCFNPQDEVALTLADMAFRCKRRMEAVTAADDAATAIRVREVATSLRVDLEREHGADLEAFRNEPNVGRMRLLATGRGCRWLMGRLDGLVEKLDAGLWGEEDGRELMRVEGEAGEALDFELASIQEMFDECREASAGGLPEGAAEAFERGLAGLVEGLKGRIGRVRGALEDRLAFVNGDLGDLFKLKTEAAKFDPGDEGRLRRRYLIDAQREFLKALAAARQASGPAVSAEEDEAQEKVAERAAWEELASLPTVEEVADEGESESPNEARSDHAGRSGGSGRKGRRPTKRRAGRRGRRPKG